MKGMQTTQADLQANIPQKELSLYRLGHDALRYTYSRMSLGQNIVFDLLQT
jgi:hypothetical protein